jgi:hypothetical protein
MNKRCDESLCSVFRLEHNETRTGAMVEYGSSKVAAIWWTEMTSFYGIDCVRGLEGNEHKTSLLEPGGE